MIGIFGRKRGYAHAPLRSRFGRGPALIMLQALMLVAADNPVKVTKLEDPEKALSFEVTVPAKLDQVWRAFTTKDGAEEWLWPDMTVELREGGDWIVHYPGGTTGGGTIVSFEPMRSITMRAMAPEQFPEVRRERTTALFQFEAAESGTKVTLLQTGWKKGKEWDEAYEYLASGNAQLLKQLLYRFQKGPIDWDKMLHSK